MNLAMPLNSYNEYDRSEKALTFSSSSILVIKNIPSASLAIVLLPIYVCLFIPVIYFLLHGVKKAFGKQNTMLKSNRYSLTYDEASLVYKNLNAAISQLETTVKLIDKAKTDFFLKGVYKTFVEIEAIAIESKKAISDTLFFKTEQSPLTTEEKKLFAELNEIWGTDDDGVYARNTHYHLTHGIQD